MADQVQQIEAENIAENQFDASNPEQVNAARKKASRKKTQRLVVIQALMQHEDGRRWMRELLQRCHIYGNCLVQGDPYGTHFRMGEENIGKMIMADVIEAAPAEYLKMCEEGRRDK